MHIRKILHALFCMILGALFIYAGMAKLLDLASFSSALAGLKFIPVPVINPLAMGLPAVEFVFGVCVLTIPALRRAGALGLACLLVTFLAVLGWTWATGAQVGCACFGAGSILEFGGLQGAIVRNGILLAIAWMIIRHFDVRDSQRYS